MKKWILLVALVIGIFVILPNKSQAQYRSPYIYTNNAYLNYSLASARAKKARAAAAKKKALRNKKRKNMRRVSVLEFMPLKRNEDGLNPKKNNVI